MDPQNNIASEQITQQNLPEPKKCKHMPIIIILVLLLVGACTFGGFELWQGIQKDKEIKTLQAENEQKNEESEPIEVTDDNEIQKVIELLSKYKIDVDNKDVQPMYATEFAYNALDNFTKDFKDSYIALIILEEHLVSESSPLSYEDANDIYHSYFGDDEDFSKSNYRWYCDNIIYNSDGDNYIIQPILDCGVGGTTPERILYKIDSIKKKDNELTVRINSVIYNPWWGTDLNLQEPYETISDSLASHVLHFEKYNDSYALIDIE